MAINPNTNATMSGRITAPDADYPYGSAKDESSPGAGDGTPYFRARANDIFGLQQALLRLAGIVPSGNAETARNAQYLSALIQLAMGRAELYDDTGAADAYILALRTNQQAPLGRFEGMRVTFTPDNTNTGASTVDISELLGQSAGTTVVDILKADGVSDPDAGQIEAGVDITLIDRTAYFEIFEVGSELPANVAYLDVTQTFTKAQRGSTTTLTDAANISVDMAANVDFYVELGGNRTLDNPTNLVAGQSGTFTLKQDATGNRELAFGSLYLNTPDSLSSIAEAFDELPYKTKDLGGTVYVIFGSILQNVTEVV